MHQQPGMLMHTHEHSVVMEDKLFRVTSKRFVIYLSIQGK